MSSSALDVLDDRGGDNPQGLHVILSRSTRHSQVCDLAAVRFQAVHTWPKFSRLAFDPQPIGPPLEAVRFQIREHDFLVAGHQHPRSGHARCHPSHGE
jgi:hypothetical protein